MILSNRKFFCNNGDCSRRTFSEKFQFIADKAKKRYKYATVIINIETRKIVDILKSRDYEEVKEWLKTFPNIEIISRDGSITYNKAIKDAHPKSIQISDRFHILKNLTDYCKNI